MKRVYPWERLWISAGTSVRCGHSGMDFFTPSGSKELKAIDLIHGPRLLVLLGGVGWGKSTEIEALRSHLAELGAARLFKATSLAGNPADVIERSLEWRSHQAGGGELAILIDGIDEALTHHPTLLETLTVFIQDSASPRLRFILSMRSGAWYGDRYRGMFSAWNTSAEAATFELCPLTRDDIGVVFRERALGDLSGFFEWAWSTGNSPLARVPIFLDQTIEDWRDGRMDHLTIHQLRERQVISLLRRNPDPALPRLGLKPAESRALAELFSVHAILGGKARFERSGSGSGGAETFDVDTLLDSPLSGNWRADGRPFNFSSDDLAKVFDCALFSRTSGADEPPAYSFTHQSYAEHLASAVLQREPLRRLLQLLGSAGDSRIAPQMENLAILLAPFQSGLAHWLLTHQPDLLLASDASGFDDAFKNEIVLAALRLIESSDENRRLNQYRIDVGYGSEDVHETLRLHIGNSNLRPLTRHAAFLITERCPSSGHIDLLWEILNDRNEEGEIRQSAFHSWLVQISFDPGSHSNHLWAIARNSTGDFKRRHQADALRVLLKAGVPVREILPFVPQRSERSYGSLEILLAKDLPHYLTSEDLPAALDFLVQRPKLSINGRLEDEFPLEVYKACLIHLHETAILKAFAKHWWDIDDSDHLHLSFNLSSNLQTVVDSEFKLLLTALIETPSYPEGDAAWNLPWRPSVFQWAVEVYLQSLSRTRSRWLQFVARHWKEYTRDEVPEWLIESYEGFDEGLRRALPTKRPFESLRDCIKRFHEEQQKELLAIRETAKAQFAQRQRLQDRSTFSFQIEEGLATNPIQTWLHFCNYAWIARPGDPEGSRPDPDRITESSSWLGLSVSAKNLARRAAILFLTEGFSALSLYHPPLVEEAAYIAIDLLASEIESQKNLQELVKRYWITSVVFPHYSNTKRHISLVGLLKTFSPSRIRRLMVGHLEQGLERRFGLTGFSKFVSNWSIEDGEALARVLCSRLIGEARRRSDASFSRATPSKRRHRVAELRETAREFLEAYKILRSNSPGVARSLIEELTHCPLTLRKREVPALAQLLLLGIFDFPEFWDKGWSTFRTLPKTAITIALNEFASEVSDGSQHWNDQITAQHLKEFYLCWDRMFPFLEGDPFDRKSEPGFVTPANHRWDLERAIWVKLQNDGSAAEMVDLIQLLSCIKRREMLRYYLVEARSHLAASKWQSPSPFEISKWLIESSGVLVRNEAELLNAVLVSLDRYQDRLRGGGNVLDCWERQGSREEGFRPTHEEDLSAKIAEHLKTDLQTIVVSREEEIRLGVRKNKADIKISLVAYQRVLQLIIEHKRAHNPQVTTGMMDQLIERYLHQIGAVAGIYLVSWFDGFEQSSEPVRNALKVTTPEKAAEWLEEEAERCSRISGTTVKSFLLDCSCSSVGRL